MKAQSYVFPRRNIKNYILYASKWTGLFKASRLLTRRGLRILCYHSFSQQEGIDWHPDLFICPGTFQKRLLFLAKNNNPVMKLNEALERLEKNQIPSGATVITIDDGWVSTLTHAHKILSQYSIPYTVYVTSYYSSKDAPIFNMAVRYMFWKTRKENIELRQIGLSCDEKATLADEKSKNVIMRKIIDYGHDQLSHTARQVFMHRLGEYLGVDYSKIEQSKFLNILSSDQIKELSRSGADIQLHTHRHHLPLDRDSIFKELDENRRYLEPLVGRSLQHFCFPNGLWNKEHLPHMQSAGIKSATTCIPGLNYANACMLTLKRFFDSEKKSQIEFESDICGYSELLNRFRGRLQ